MSRFDHVFVLGAGGILGRQMVAALTSRGITPLATRHADLDIADESAVQKRLGERPWTLIINCAAFTRVDDCEAQLETAMRINGQAVGTLADLARRSGALLVHLSSDYVFPGNGARPYREDDAVGRDAELTAYGRSKLDGDRRIFASGCRYLIARTSWVYGSGGPNFVDTILKAAQARPELKVVNDQRGRPTYAVDLAAGILSLLDHDAEGIVNVANSDECTWYEFAREIVQQAGLSIPVHPCSTAEFPRPARRPTYSVLDLSRYTTIVGRPLRSWRDALRAYLAAR